MSAKKVNCVALVFLISSSVPQTTRLSIIIQHKTSAVVKMFFKKKLMRAVCSITCWSTDMDQKQLFQKRSLYVTRSKGWRVFVLWMHYVNRWMLLNIILWRIHVFSIQSIWMAWIFLIILFCCWDFFNFYCKLKCL